MEPQFECINFPLEDFNHGAQLVATRNLLYRHKRADRDLSDRIKQADEVARQARGRASEHAVDVCVELAEMSCYQDAAHSMAAVSMLAPLIESVFQTAFHSIGNKLPDWNLVENIVKRVEEVGLKEYLPEDLEQTLDALFKYRNKMFHGGFEWSSKELKNFEGLLEKDRWLSGWFSLATPNR